MAEQERTPTLPSTADPIPYVPISWMAVTSSFVSLSYVILLVVLGLWSVLTRKPLIIDQLLVLPVIGVVLSFASRRMIRNSEGTRTADFEFQNRGRVWWTVNLVNASWWVCVIGGLGYGAYLFAIDSSIRRDASSETKRFIDYVLKDDPANPLHPDLYAAFIMTLEPDRRRNLTPSNPTQLEGEYRDQVIALKDSDLVRLAQRNPGDCKFTLETLKEWIPRTYGVDSTLTGEIKCREGTFPISLPIKGVEPGFSNQSTSRKWLVIVPPSGVFVRESIKRTRYGWMIESLEETGTMFAGDFLNQANRGVNNYPHIYHNLVEPLANLQHWFLVSVTTPGRMAVGGGPAYSVPYYTADSVNYYRNEFFKLPGGGDPSAEQKSTFNKAWESVGLVASGTRIKNSPDKSPVLTITESSIEIRVPAELPFPGGDGTVARCRIVLKLTDPAVISELKKLREEASNGQETSAPPADIAPTVKGGTRIYVWRLARIETDLRPVSTGPQRGQGAPGQ